MDPLLLSETTQLVSEAKAADPTLSHTDATQTVVHGGITHDIAPCTSRLCAKVTGLQDGGRR